MMKNITLLLALLTINVCHAAEEFVIHRVSCTTYTQEGSRHKDSYRIDFFDKKGDPVCFIVKDSPPEAKDIARVKKTNVVNLSKVEKGLEARIAKLAADLKRSQEQPGAFTQEDDEEMQTCCSIM